MQDQATKDYQGMSADRQARRRKADLAQIHMALHDIGLDRDRPRYEAIVEEIGGVRSSALLNARQRMALLARLRAMGAGKKYLRKTRLPQDARPQHRKIVALWVSLGQVGALVDTSDAALQAFIERLTGVSHLRWLKGYHCNQVIEALKDWRGRVLKRVNSSANE